MLDDIKDCRGTQDFVVEECELPGSEVDRDGLFVAVNSMGVLYVEDRLAAKKHPRGLVDEYAELVGLLASQMGQMRNYHNVALEVLQEHQLHHPVSQDERLVGGEMRCWPPASGSPGHATLGK